MLPVEQIVSAFVLGAAVRDSISRLEDDYLGLEDV
jgi:hypothetical protein